MPLLVALPALGEVPGTPQPVTSGAQREFNLPRGTLWQLRLEHSGADVVLEVLAPGATAPVRYNSRMGSVGADTALIEVARGGTYRVAIAAAEPGMPDGQAELNLSRVDPDTRDARWLAALRSESEANRLAASAGVQHRPAASAAFESAAQDYLQAGDELRAADALFSLAALQRVQGAMLAAIASYEKSIAIYQRHDEVARLASARFGAGAIHSETGRFEQAQQLLDQAIAGFAATDNPLEAMQARNCLCLSFHRHEELERAQACYAEVLAGFERLEAPREQALVLNNIGGLLYARQRTDEAERMFSRALEIEQGYRPDGENARLFRNNIALAARRNGDYQRALELYMLNAAEARASADRVALGRALNNAGFAWLDLGDYPRAGENFRAALELRRTLEDREGTAGTLNNLARVQRLLGAYEDARTHHLLARELAQEIGSRDLQAAADIGLGDIALALGEPRVALEHFVAVSELLAAAEYRSKLDDAWHGAGVASLRLGALEDAARYLSRALVLREQQRYPAARTETLYALAQLEAGRGRLDVASSHIDAALAVVESTRADLLVPETRASYLAAEHGIYGLQVDVLMQRHAREPGMGFDRLALAANERARARTLLEQVVLRDPALGPRADPALLERERLLARQLAAALDGGAGQERIRELGRELRDVGEEISAADPRYASTMRPEPLDAAGIQAALGPGVTLLQFALGEPRSYLWQVDEDSVRAHVLAPRSRLEALAQEFYRASRVNNPSAAVRTTRLAVELGAVLLGAVQPLPADRRLVIVADGALHHVPFAALADASGTRLIERHELVLAPSVSTVAMQRRARSAVATRMLAIVADPVLGPDDERMAFAPVARMEPVLQLAVAEQGLRASGAGALERLASAGREASAIAALVPAPERMLATGYAARRSLVVDGGLAPYRIVHFATHGVVDGDNPLASGLALSRYSERGEELPGFLSLADLARLDLTADLVVLSACDTALGREQRGEGLIGLTRGFMRAGASRVMASSWRISDRATADFMLDFYRHLLLDDASAPAALRAAQRAFLAGPRNAQPFYWAAFSLNGDWR